MTSWPRSPLYDDALQDPEWAFASPPLKQASFSVSSNRGLIHATGNFAAVARAKVDGVDYAVRMFVSEQRDLGRRYVAVGKVKSPVSQYLAGVEFFGDEIRVDESGKRFPVVLLQWVDGQPLGTFVADACARRDTAALGKLRGQLRQMRSTLSGAGVAHGDISPSNILVSATSTGIRTWLIDYDSFWTPEIKDLPCSVGIGPLQHPKRPNPIGQHADQAAFVLIDLVLSVLLNAPELGATATAFDETFVVGVQDLLSPTKAEAKAIAAVPEAKQVISYLRSSDISQGVPTLQSETYLGAGTATPRPKRRASSGTQTGAASPSKTSGPATSRTAGGSGPTLRELAQSCDVALGDVLREAKTTQPAPIFADSVATVATVRAVESLRSQQLPTPKAQRTLRTLATELKAPVDDVLAAARLYSSGTSWNHDSPLSAHTEAGVTRAYDAIRQRRSGRTIGDLAKELGEPLARVLEIANRGSAGGHVTAAYPLSAELDQQIRAAVRSQKPPSTASSESQSQAGGHKTIQILAVELNTSYSKVIDAARSVNGFRIWLTYSVVNVTEEQAIRQRLGASVQAKPRTLLTLATELKAPVDEVLAAARAFAPGVAWSANFPVRPDQKAGIKRTLRARQSALKAERRTSASPGETIRTLAVAMRSPLESVLMAARGYSPAQTWTVDSPLTPTQRSGIVSALKAINSSQLNSTQTISALAVELDEDVGVVVGLATRLQKEQDKGILPSSVVDVALREQIRTAHYVLVNGSKLRFHTVRLTRGRVDPEKTVVLIRDAIRGPSPARTRLVALVLGLISVAIFIAITLERSSSSQGSAATITAAPPTTVRAAPPPHSPTTLPIRVATATTTPGTSAPATSAPPVRFVTERFATTPREGSAEGSLQVIRAVRLDAKFPASAVVRADGLGLCHVDGGHCYEAESVSPDIDRTGFKTTFLVNAAEADGAWYPRLDGSPLAQSLTLRADAARPGWSAPPTTTIPQPPTFASDSFEPPVASRNPGGSVDVVRRVKVAGSRSLMPDARRLTGRLCSQSARQCLSPSPVEAISEAGDTTYVVRFGIPGNAANGNWIGSFEGSSADTLTLPDNRSSLTVNVADPVVEVVLESFPPEVLDVRSASSTVRWSFRVRDSHGRLPDFSYSIGNPVLCLVSTQTCVNGSVVGYSGSSSEKLLNVDFTLRGESRNAGVWVADVRGLERWLGLESLGVLRGRSSLTVTIATSG